MSIVGHHSALQNTTAAAGADNEGQSAIDPLQAVIFDVDGTLADTERDGHRVAFNEAFNAAGLSYQWSVPEYGGLLATTGGPRGLERYLPSKRHPLSEAPALGAELHR